MFGSRRSVLSLFSLNGGEGGGGGGDVTSVNGKTGDVVLKAEDINAKNTQTIQENLERIDSDVADRQITYLISDFPEELDENFLYRLERSITHSGKTYEKGLYQVINNDLVVIGNNSLETNLFEFNYTNGEISLEKTIKGA